MSDGVAYLQSTTAIRERCRNVLAATRSGKSQWFTVNDTALASAAVQVANVTRQRYPTLNIPYHSRWRHFEPGGVDRKALLDAALDNASPAEKARAHIDLAVVSVLLDAGAGAAWRYVEASTGQIFTRSEGLGIASLHAFMQGLFSSDPSKPLRADANGLKALTGKRLTPVFQVAPDNPLVGLEGRATLMQSLGAALAIEPKWFGSSTRPGGLFDALTENGLRTSIRADEVLAALLEGLGSIWPSGNQLDGIALGDCWQHPLAGGTGATAGWIPIHKLSQWMTYSLLEPFEWAGVQLTDFDALTGLAEYRNGGLLVDSGILIAAPLLRSRGYAPSEEPIIEWRALTVALLDELAPLVRTALGRSAANLPLTCILEGGTWAAGRALASSLRGGEPPIRIVSDGTVF